MELKRLFIIFILFNVAQALRKGNCDCQFQFQDRTIQYTTNDCGIRFKPTYELLVMPMHPGTGSPLVKTRCVCTCKLDLRQGSYFKK